MPSFQRRKLWRWACWGEFAAKIYVHGETFGKLIRRFTQLIPVSKPGAEAELLRPRCRTRQGCFGEGGSSFRAPAAASLLLPAINKSRVFNKLMSGGRRGAGRCVPGDISWRAAWQQRGAGREQAASPGCVPLSWVFWQGGELVCLAGPSHLGSICVSLESDRRLQAVRNRRCAGPDTCPANERRRQAGLRLRSKITGGGGGGRGRALFSLFETNEVYCTAAGSLQPRCVG